MASAVFTLTLLSSRFDNVPLVTPNGDVLIPNLSFEVGLVDAFVSSLSFDGVA